ncbi:MAG: hypothetical protein ACTSU0_09365, partial [Alphaproteobacteria bacterium]
AAPAARATEDPVAAAHQQTAPGLSLSAQAFLDMDRGARLRAIARIAGGSLNHLPERANPPPAFSQIVSTAEIIGFARARKADEMIDAIATSLDLPDRMVRASVNDATGELLAILLKALRLDNVTAQQVFLVMSPAGRDVSCFFPLSDLFSGMETFVADAIVDRWRDGETGPVRHETPMPEIPSRREERIHERQRPAAHQTVHFGRAKRG